MASGDTLATFYPQDNVPPSASFATLDVRNGHLVLDFDAAADESAIFPGFLPRNYAGGGITATIVWMATSATSGDCVWSLAFERHLDGTDDLDADSFAAVQSVTATTHATAGNPNYDTIAFTNGAQMDSVAAGESFRLKLTRDADAAGDTMTGDGEVLRLELRES